MKKFKVGDIVRHFRWPEAVGIITELSACDKIANVKFLLPVNGRHPFSGEIYLSSLRHVT